METVCEKKQIKLNKNKNHIKDTVSRKVFIILDYLLLFTLAFICFVPFLHLLALSFSSNDAISARKVLLWPVDFTTFAYEFLAKDSQFFKSLGISIFRVGVGTLLQMIITFITAYPLSKESHQFRARTLFVWFYAITMFIGGTLASNFVVYNALGLRNNLLVYVLPGAFSIGNTIMMLNFLRGIPKELEEAAMLDGCSQLKVLFKVYLPLCAPCIATIALFTAIGYWNSWFDAIIYIDDMELHPLATYLYSQINTTDINSIKNNLTGEQAALISQLNKQNLQSAQIFLSILPILLVYPLLQKYFAKGIRVGSVKG